MGLTVQPRSAAQPGRGKFPVPQCPCGQPWGQHRVPVMEWALCTCPQQQEAAEDPHCAKLMKNSNSAVFLSSSPWKIPAAPGHSLG